MTVSQPEQRCKALQNDTDDDIDGRRLGHHVLAHDTRLLGGNL